MKSLHTKRVTLSILAGSILLLSGCVQHRTPTPAAIVEPSDGPPTEIQDISLIQDAVPQAEPRARYGNHSPYHVLGKTYHVLESASGYVEDGIGSWYGEKFAGRKTSSFEPYDPYAMTAAHKSLPLPTYVRVTNLENNRQIVVKVNDRGPFHDGRIIDLSYAAAAKIGYMNKGTARVRVEAIEMPVLAETAAQPEPSITRIYLQVAAFSQLASAQALEKQLEPIVDAPILINSDNDTAPPVHRVRVGPFDDETSATLIKEQIKIQNMGNPLIIHR